MIKKGKGKLAIKSIIGATCTCLLIFSASSNAAIYNFTWTGAFTVLDSSGNFVNNTDAVTNNWDGNRTDIAGTFSLDTNTGSGSMTVDPFDFFGGSSPVEFTSVTTQSIGGNLMVGNFIYNWSGNTGLNMDLVWDVTGLVDALGLGMAAGDVISGDTAIIGGVPFTIGSALPASNSVVGSGPIPASYPIGPTPMATTDLDLTTVGGLTPVADLSGVAGSPQATGPYLGFSASLDIGDANSMHLVSVSTVPVPAAVWLFGSGLIGLIGFARRKKV